MSYLPAINTLWAHAAHPSTRAGSRSASPEPSGAPAEELQAAGGNPATQLSAARQATLRRRLLRQCTRGDHLPARSKSAEQARMLRYLKGYPQLGSTAEADQLSDLEESIEVGKHHAIRFGERYIVQIGRRRTMREEELSNEEDEVRRPNATMDGSAAEGAALDEASSDSEGGPGLFVGGHTGHAQAEAQQTQAMEAQRRARDAEAEANRAAAAAIAARNQAARQAAIQEEQNAIDLDADIEDLDQGEEEDVDFD